MENQTIYAIYRQDLPKQKPGLFRTYRRALAYLAILVCSTATMVAFIVGLVIWIGSHQDLTIAAVFAGGIVGLTGLLFRDMRTRGRAAAWWGGALLLLAVAVAVRSIVGVI